MAAMSQITFSNAISSNENGWILIKISLKFVPNGQIDRSAILVLVMAWSWQAITWTNADPVYQRVYMALGGDELTLEVS